MTVVQDHIGRTWREIGDAKDHGFNAFGLADGVAIVAIGAAQTSRIFFAGVTGLTAHPDNLRDGCTFSAHINGGVPMCSGWADTCAHHGSNRRFIGGWLTQTNITVFTDINGGGAASEQQWK
jgi:hypothetical protein